MKLSSWIALILIAAVWLVIGAALRAHFPMEKPAYTRSPYFQVPAATVFILSGLYFLFETFTRLRKPH